MIKLCSVEKNLLKIELKVAICGSILDVKEGIQSALNEAGTLLTQESLNALIPMVRRF